MKFEKIPKDGNQSFMDDQSIASERKSSKKKLHTWNSPEILRELNLPEKLLDKNRVSFETIPLELITNENKKKLNIKYKNKNKTSD